MKGDKQEIITSTLREYGIETIPQYNEGKHVQNIGGKKTLYSGDIPNVGIFYLLDLHYSLSKINEYTASVCKSFLFVFKISYS